MQISEIFYSVQGEGELTGVPSVFVRTAGCNLRCVWCDTKYAWAGGESLAVGRIVELVTVHPTRFCVLTGGEPMLAEGIRDLAAQLQAQGKHITIETAGTLPPGGIACSLASISPKLSTSTPPPESAGEWSAKHEQARLQPEAIREWVLNYPYQLKFVVRAEEDVPEITDILASLRLPIPPERVLLMPEGTDRATLAARVPFLWETCRRHGFRYCQRLHVELFGNRRGV